MEDNAILNTDRPEDSSSVEGIVRTRISLPPEGRDCIDRDPYFPDKEDHVSSIARLLRNLEIDEKRIEDFEKIFTPIYTSQLSKLFPTLERINLFLHGLNQSLPSLKEEVHLPDFLILEAFRTFYPNVYEDIFEYPWIYLPPWGEAAFFSFSHEFTTRDDRTYLLIKEHIETLCENQEKPEVLRQLLQVLFFEVRKGFSNTHVGDDASEPEYLRQKRLSHPDVFWKYFSFSVPAREAPEQVVESFINAWSRLGQEDFGENGDSHLSSVSNRKQLNELWQKSRMFMPRMTRETSIVLIECLYKNMHLFRREGADIFHDPESLAAIRLLFDLIDNKLHSDEMEVVLSDLVQKTPSFELAVRVVDNVRSRMRDLFNIPGQGNFYALSSQLDERLTAHFIEGRRNIFKEEKNYGYILAQWGTYKPQNNLKVNDYVCELVKEDPTAIGKVLGVYTNNHGDKTGVRIRWEDLAKLYDENRLYELASQYLDSSYSNGDERTAVELFMSQYETRTGAAALEITQQSNKEKFMHASSQGIQLFRVGQYELALEEFNRALGITDWNDEVHFVRFLQLQKWHTLLELGLKSEGEVRTQFHSNAQRIASDDGEIRDLFNAAFPKCAAHAVQELYCCIFYYLQWEAASAVEKDSVKKHFDAHFSLATAKRTFGGTEEITKRCSELLVLLIQ
jgi:tetratricopeptide (TPR) repeat protein